MFDIGGWELLVIGALALIIVGPKDLPRMVRSVGQWVAKARGLAREFQSGMEEAARDADLHDLKKATKMDAGLSDSLNEVKSQLRSIGTDTKRAIESPYDAAKAAGRSAADPSSDDAVDSAPTPVPPAVATQNTMLSSSGGGSSAAPTAKAANGASAPNVDDRPRGAVSAPEGDEDKAFLERFERSVRSNGD